MKTLCVKKTVEFSETDLAGIVHFSNFGKYMELAEHEFFRQIDSSVVLPRDEEGNHYGWPRKSANMGFLYPLRFEDEIEIRMTLKKLRAATLTYHSEIYLIEEDKETLAVKGEVTIVHSRIWDRSKKLEALMIPDDLRKKIEEFWQD